MPDQPVQYQLIGSDGIEYGPASIEEVRQWIREGRASAKTMAKASDNPAWRKLGEIPEFAEAIAQRAANAPSGGKSAAPQPEQNKLARMGFILSLVSLLCCCVPLAPVGLILSIISLVRINSGKDLREGYGFALAGIIIAVVVIIINIIAFNYFPGFFSGIGSQKVFAP
ncbi:MAG TPA: DUF4190 domain-containing protein [Verrucomicrobiae bacterium]